MDVVEVEGDMEVFVTNTAAVAEVVVDGFSREIGAIVAGVVVAFVTKTVLEEPDDEVGAVVTGLI
jgi:hypothetical protein